MFISLAGISQEKCGTTIYTEILKDRYPDYAIERDKVDEQTKKWIKNKKANMTQSIITIPVVHHVVCCTVALSFLFFYMYIKLLKHRYFLHRR